MTTFLFWNVNRKDLSDLIADVALERSVDVIMLAECRVPPADLLRKLNRRVRSDFHYASNGTEPVLFFTNFSRGFSRVREVGARYSVRELTLPGAVTILLFAVHLQSKLYWNDDSQAQQCTQLAHIIRSHEIGAGHNRTVMVGDLNMNPFEKGVVGAAGFNATMHRGIAAKGERTVAGDRFPFFYNPMWNHLGDARNPIAGTYYYDRNEHVNYFWNIFDQVLLRPDLMDRLKPGSVQIVTAVGAIDLTDPQGRPNKRVASDHLPLLFSLNLTE